MLCFFLLLLGKFIVGRDGGLVSRSIQKKSKFPLFNISKLNSENRFCFSFPVFSSINQLCEEERETLSVN